MNPQARDKHSGSMPALHIQHSNDRITPLLTDERVSVEQRGEGDPVDIKLAPDAVHLPTASRLDQASADSHQAESKPP